ncbi:hypothetical protein SAMN05216419_100223 [Nitrosomonas cryotolerans]|uniref:Inner membrane protein n=1 Tax=Nitrosomonas cryotolerans ATCC 49181 TaxID=1131553 RepID=A0A1N6GQ89_9PROT|nr:hypothetical protein SAMN05216419_100223 [Nitrosomonas cryotolerans]SIO09668.1 hypothetical protein SAMN02743940_0813 [Nitrosomonas cryotolerans ATCC 49181]
MQQPLNKEIDLTQDKKKQNTQENSLLRIHDSRLMRGLYLGGGIIALILGALGAILPILPTTPFILLAAACFARSSESFHNKLLANRIAGPVIREWCLYKSIPYRVKRWAYLLMALSFGTSILLVPAVWHKVMLGVIAAILAIFIWRIPVRDSCTRYKTS